MSELAARQGLSQDRWDWIIHNEVRLRGYAASASQTSLVSCSLCAGAEGALDEVWLGVRDDFRDWLLTAA